MGMPDFSSCLSFPRCQHRGEGWCSGCSSSWLSPSAAAPMVPCPPSLSGKQSWQEKQERCFKDAESSWSPAGSSGSLRCSSLGGRQTEPQRGHRPALVPALSEDEQGKRWQTDLTETQWAQSPGPPAPPFDLWLLLLGSHGTQMPSSLTATGRFWASCLPASYSRISWTGSRGEPAFSWLLPAPPMHHDLEGPSLVSSLA